MTKSKPPAVDEPPAAHVADNDEDEPENDERNERHVSGQHEIC
jgi:hypothetical protein